MYSKTEMLLVLCLDSLRDRDVKISLYNYSLKERTINTDPSPLVIESCNSRRVLRNITIWCRWIYSKSKYEIKCNNRKKYFTSPIEALHHILALLKNVLE